ncbi:uncharacterized protein BP01DRAFT_72653 [Aspergillus saccharolyticus JOP 1030-1]|uniref:Uncharacterized protein n=1 Tax=Aspergillus saccharolyticus JOP 1030-1 TaxID=1450539 RepID=A0A318ZR96_9EURO|nr:hypothetical protein BP01DRAFT_72653 [Aspergillus saccharolyticus JOP 1030-1]PYH49175.1 hypothetical protein BP01DRAFT_72653 [Aspergillus saccharolyticus JOP 1030-1]
MRDPRRPQAEGNFSVLGMVVGAPPGKHRTGEYFGMVPLFVSFIHGLWCYFQLLSNWSSIAKCEVFGHVAFFLYTLGVVPRTFFSVVCLVLGLLFVSIPSYAWMSIAKNNGS